MNQTASAIRDLNKAPVAGDIFQLDENAYVTVLSVGAGQIRYVSGAVDSDMFREAPEDLLRSAKVMPYKTFRKWLASIAAGRRMDTPPPA
jgi:hypothetical protein